MNYTLNHEVGEELATLSLVAILSLPVAPPETGGVLSGALPQQLAADRLEELLPELLSKLLYPRRRPAS